MTEPLTPAAAAQPASTADRAALLGPGSERAAKVRAEVQRILLAEGMSQAKLAAEAGVPKGSISPWLGAKWPIGENGANSKAGEHVQLALEKWLATRERSAAVVTAASSKSGIDSRSISVTPEKFAPPTDDENPPLPSKFRMPVSPAAARSPMLPTTPTPHELFKRAYFLSP
jgi:transcriptional regulator with XRE-family HTH domain